MKNKDVKEVFKLSLTIQKNSRQIPDVVEYTADKKYSDLLYSVLQEMSVMDPENGIRYIEKKELNYSALSGRVGVTRQIVSKRVNNLIDLGLIEFDIKKKKYKLNYLDKSVCSLIPCDTLSVLNNTLSENCISIYVYLLNRFIANQEGTYLVTMAQMKRFIGIAANTTSNNNVIKDILQVLSLIGLVEWTYEIDSHKQMHIRVLDVRNRIKPI